MMIIRYHVEHFGERAAGIYPFSDLVTVTVNSGDPGGEHDGPDSFQSYVLTSLREWYDGAQVMIMDVRFDMEV